MARRIAEESQESLPKDGDALDQVLGSLKRRGVDVHSKVKKIIADPDSEPNSLHHAIADLAQSPPANSAPRVVTTNYDRHLSTCLGDDVAGFPSNALPTGKDFRGVVYVHGSVDEPAQHLVVTDRDLAMAYVNQPAPAAHFLGLVFAGCTVLFIGYRHKDTLMEYLAKGLPDGTERYAFCDPADEEQRWRDLGIEPIAYQSHDDLPLIIQEWAARSRMLMQDHKQKVQEIISRAGPLCAADESYLDETLGSSERQKFFCDVARGERWLHWAASRPEFKKIFDPAATTAQEGEMARWFSAHYATDPHQCGSAMSVFGNCGGRFSRGLWQEMAWAVRIALEAGGNAAAESKKWIPLLVDQAPVRADGNLWWVLQGCDPVEDPHSALLLFDRLLEPAAALSEFASSDGGRSLQIRPSAFIRGLKNYWEEKLRPSLQEEELAMEIAVIADGHLRAAIRILAANGDPASEWARINLSRRAIEDHPQNELSLIKGLDFLLEVARDTLETLVQYHPEQAERYLQEWGRSQIPVLNRLAAHGWAERQDIAADHKLEFLVESGWALETALWHETMRLAATALPEASEIATENLVQHIRAGWPPQDAEAEAANEESRAQRRRHLVCTWLDWIIAHARHTDGAELALADAQAGCPDWRPSQHPDFRRWHLPATITAPEMGSPEELRQKLLDDAASALGELKDPEKRAAGSGETLGWGEALSWLRTTAEAYPADTARVIDQIVGQSSNEELRLNQEIAQAVLGSLVDAELDDDLCELLIDRLAAIWDTGTSEWSQPSQIQGWDQDWLTHAINHWAGQTAQLALRLLQHDRQRAGDDWAGLQGPLRAVMEEIASGNSYPAQLAQVILAMRASFLFAIDERWCRANVLPLLDPANGQDQSLRCWDGYLANPNLDVDLLKSALLDFYIAMIPHYEQQSIDGARDYNQHLAAIAFCGDISPIKHGWLNRFTAKAGSEARSRWIWAVTSRLSQMPGVDTDAQWGAWIREYWENRLQSTPRDLEPGEAASMIHWVVYFQDRFPEAVGLASQRPASMEHCQMVASDLNLASNREGRTDHVAANPEPTARLMAHLLSAVDTLPSRADSSLKFDLDCIVPILLDSIDGNTASQLRHEALRLGIETTTRRT